MKIRRNRKARELKVNLTFSELLRIHGYLCASKIHAQRHVMEARDEERKKAHKAEVEAITVLIDKTFEVLGRNWK